jgi:hypothetical protein
MRRVIFLIERSSEGDTMKSSVDGTDAIAVSESAKQQIGSQAAKGKPKLQGPSFLDGFPESGPPTISSSGVNVAAVHWKL